MTKVNRPYHLHVGLGRLGMGLVLELISPKVPLIILQRRVSASNNWLKDLLGELKSQTVVTLKNYVVEDKTVKPFRLLRKLNVREIDRNIQTIEEEIRNSESGSFLLIYSKLTDLNWVSKYCATMTASIKDEGWREFEPWLENDAEECGMIIYPFENEVKVKSTKNTIIPVTPDRICAKDVEFSKNPLTLSIQVENFTHIVIKAPEQVWKGLFDIRSEDEVTAAASDALFDFYSHRKRYLVNGLHYYLASFGYGRLLDIQVPVRDWSNQYLPIVIEYVLSDAGKSQHAIDVLIGAQAMRLILEFQSDEPSLDDYERVFSGRSEEQVFLSLCEYGMLNLARFKKITDSLDRILKLDDYRKFIAKTEIFRTDLSIFLAEKDGPIELFSARLKPWRSDLSHVIIQLGKLERVVWAKYFETVKDNAKELSAASAQKE